MENSEDAGRFVAFLPATGGKPCLWQAGGFGEELSNFVGVAKQH